MNVLSEKAAEAMAAIAAYAAKNGHGMMTNTKREDRTSGNAYQLVEDVPAFYGENIKLKKNGNISFDADAGQNNFAFEMPLGSKISPQSRYRLWMNEFVMSDGTTKVTHRAAPEGVDANSLSVIFLSPSERRKEIKEARLSGDTKKLSRLIPELVGEIDSSKSVLEEENYEEDYEEETPAPPVKKRRKTTRK